MYFFHLRGSFVSEKVENRGALLSICALASANATKQKLGGVCTCQQLLTTKCLNTFLFSSRVRLHLLRPDEGTRSQTLYEILYAILRLSPLRTPCHAISQDVKGYPLHSSMRSPHTHARMEYSISIWNAYEL